ncbi:Imm1 family immunity protein [Actinokineospora sp. HUAS TT18]|uniref:Imm1 family immunity protein n=1 Tax=Actinokineospora sp. HUAS TT18 TaxID=3447451 RepID=UPI003F51E68B
MAPLIAWYSHDHPDGIPVPSVDDVDRLIDDVQAESKRTGVPMLIQICVDDEDSPEFYAGVNGDAGVLTYAAADSPALWASSGEPSTKDELVYYYSGSSTDLPGDAEVSVEVVREAVKQFMLDPDDLPVAARWRKMR